MGDRIQVVYEQDKTTKLYGFGAPFAIRRYNWLPDYYVVVEHLDLSNGNAFGVPMKNGAMVRLFEKDEVWRQHRLIPDCKVSVWELKEDVDLSYYQRNSKGMVYELHHRLLWSDNYRFWSIEELCMNHWDFIKWSLDKLETNFCLSPQVIKAIKKSGILEREKDAKWFLKLNQQKLKWYKSGLPSELIPDWYKSDPTRRVNNQDLEQVVARAAAEIKRAQRAAKRSPA